MIHYFFQDGEGWIWKSSQHRKRYRSRIWKSQHWRVVFVEQALKVKRNYSFSKHIKYHILTSKFKSLQNGCSLADSLIFKTTQLKTNFYCSNHFLNQLNFNLQKGTVFFVKSLLKFPQTKLK